MREKKRQRKEWSVLAVQAMVGGVLLLVILLLRMLGGGLYDGVRLWFQSTISEDTLLPAETSGQGGEFLLPETARVIVAPQDATIVRRLPDVAVYPLLYGGTLTSDYGYRTDPLRGDTAFHTGVDIAAPRGTPLYAVCDATVLRVGRDNSYGNYVVLSAMDGFQLWYAHCDTIDCQVGQQMKAGDKVATVGSTGDSTGPHVHFMVKHDEIIHNPTVWIADECYA